MVTRNLSPEGYRRWTLAAVVSLVIIILTGAAVRLSGSGLGCSTWPNCEPGVFIGAANLHQTIEQVNRFFTGVMVVVIIGAVAGSLVREPRRQDLTRLSLALVVGILLQAVVGGIVVKTHLHPLAVVWHFVLSAIMVVGALALHQRAREHSSRCFVPTVAPVVRQLVLASAAVGVLVVATGTVVTGTGPHSGAYKDQPVRRFSFALVSVARIHSNMVVVLIGLLLVLYRRLRGTSDWVTLEDRFSAVLLAVFVQGGIGYAQYFSKLPVGLVAAHIAGATAVFITLTRLVLATRTTTATSPTSAAPVVVSRTD